MTDLTGADIAGIIAASASLIAAVGSTIAVVGTVLNGRKIELVHKATNGLSAELNKVTGEKAYAEGLKEGQSAVVMKVDAITSPPARGKTAPPVKSKSKRK